jgi:hypothetical protein
MPQRLAGDVHPAVDLELDKEILFGGERPLAGAS